MSENINTVERGLDLADQENAAILRKKSAVHEEITSEQASSGLETSKREALRSKSSNSFKPNISKIGTEKPLNTNLFANLGNANKARKVMSKPFSIFEPSKSFTSNISGKNIGLHDSTSLQRSTSQLKEIEKLKSLSKSSTLTGDLFSSSFGSSSGESNSKSKDARKIKSQLTMTIGNDMAAFFKKSKMEEQEKLGIQTRSNNDTFDTDKTFTKPLEEITFADESQDISSMKKVLTERDSPVYQRTRKVNIQNLLSSSTDSDEFGETTFDFKDIGTVDSDVKDLEELILSKSKPKSCHTDDFEIEYTSSRSANALYDDTTPDIVLEGIYKPIPKELLKNMWSDMPSNETKSFEFQDPLNLKQTWKNKPKQNAKPFALKEDDILKPEEFQLEFSDIEEESEDEKELLKLKEFYDNAG